MKMRGLEVAAWGTLGRDPELKMSRNGTPYCHQNVAEKAAQSLNKGARVYFEGSLTIEQWTAQDGSQRVTADIAAWKAERVAAIGKERQRDTSRPMGEPVSSPKPAGFNAPLNDEIPF
jgi:single-stranded DNA-binding protein